jgi:hypothetical protein
VQGAAEGVSPPGAPHVPLRPEGPEQLVTFAGETPMARIATVEEMVGPATFLLSPAASSVTGHDLLVEGGFTAVVNERRAVGGAATSRRRWRWLVQSFAFGGHAAGGEPP